MQKPASEPVSPEVAHDLCQRVGAKAVLLGSIAPLDSAYVVKLEAQACGSGDVVARQQVHAASKSDVLPSVGSAAARLREQRSEGLSEPERLFITSSYHFIVTGRLDQVVTTYQLWISTYPQDWIPHNNLSSAYSRLNQLDAAVHEAQAAVQLAPNIVIGYQQL